jgi:NADH:ubiquinone oxidoreductase subunit H
MLETFILSRQMALNLAFKTAIGMSLISMISMEVAMNVTDILLTGGAMLVWWVIPIMLIVGFLTPLPYNYWRLQALNKACH